MSGSNDALVQMMLMQARQDRQPSTQARLAQQMMAANMQAAQTPVWGTGATLARAGSGVLAGLMSGLAERNDQRREEEQMQRVQDRAEKRDYLQGQEASEFARRFGLPGATPAEATAEGQPAAPAAQPNWRAAALAGFGSNNPAIQRQAQAALSIGQLEDQQAARQEQMRLQRQLAAASRQPSEFERMAAAAGIRPGSPEFQELARTRLQGRPPATREERDDAVLFAPNADPNNPEYAAAYFRRFMTPRIQSFRGPNGEIMQAEVTLSPPPGLRAPGNFQGAQAPQVPPQAGAMPAMSSTPQPVGPVLSDGPAPAPAPQAMPPAAMPNLATNNAAPVPQVQAAPGRGMNITPLFSGERQAPPPAGYERDPADPTRVRPIPGSSQERDATRAQRADTEQRTQQQRAGNLVIQEIDRALNLVDTARLPTTGFVGSQLQNTPGTAANDLNRLLDTVRAETGFTRLQQMREASPTGAALGSVTERELALLQATFGSLEQSQSARQFRDNLNRVANVYLDIIHGPGQGPERRRLSFDNSRPGAQLPGSGLTADPPAPPTIAEGTTIRNPQTGERLRMQGGQWVPAR